MMRITLAAATLALSLSACMTTPVPSSGAPSPPSWMTCDADPAAWAVGKVASADVIERVRIDSHSRIVRLLRPGQMITMEFSAERVDIRVDGHNVILAVILAVTCG